MSDFGSEILSMKRFYEYYNIRKAIQKLFITSRDSLVRLTPSPVGAIDADAGE
jgi:hypothetical protein